MQHNVGVCVYRIPRKLTKRKLSQTKNVLVFLFFFLVTSTSRRPDNVACRLVSTLAEITVKSVFQADDVWSNSETSPVQFCIWVATCHHAGASKSRNCSDLGSKLSKDGRTWFNARMTRSKGRSTQAWDKGTSRCQKKKSAIPALRQKTNWNGHESKWVRTCECAEFCQQTRNEHEQPALQKLSRMMENPTEKGDTSARDVVSATTDFLSWFGVLWLITFRRGIVIQTNHRSKSTQPSNNSSQR